MPLRAGTTLGPYRIEASIGAGGMGEVYRARDTRLGRHVAIKVLPPDFADDPDRLNRFEQETRAVAALNHPNVLALYDVGRLEPGGGGQVVSYFVTELLDGRSLRQVMQNEEISIGRAVEIATGMAEGLAAAHARNVIHRDIKPDNVFITTDGVVKVLDFGLAKGGPAPDDPAQALTQIAATSGSMIMGTPGYMAPEQVRGQAVDSRADVFSFGTVLYEMLARKPPFAGPTGFDLLSAIVRDTPAPLPSTPGRPIPPALALIVERCLEKSPAARFQSTKDLAFALKTLSRVDTRSFGTPSIPAATTPSTAASAPAIAGAPPGSVAPRATAPMRGPLWAIAGVAVAVAAGLAIWQPWTNQRAGEAPAPARTADATPSRPAPAAPSNPGGSSTPPAVPAIAPATSAPPRATAPAATAAPAAPAPAPPTPAASAPVPAAPASTSTSPKTAAAAPTKLGALQPVQRLAIALGDTPLYMGTSGTSASPVALSSDGQRLVFVGTDKNRTNPALYVRPINEFQAVRLAGTDAASNPFFSPDGKSVGFFAAGALKRVAIAGGAVETIAPIGSRVAGGISWGPDGLIVFGVPLFRVAAAGGAPEDLSLSGQAPQVLPGGLILFTATSPGQLPRAAIRLPDGTVKELVRNAMNPRYLPPGYLVYAERDALLALKFDLKKLEVSGSPVQVLDTVQGSLQGWSAFTVSASGSLAYLPGAVIPGPPGGRVITWIEAASGREALWPTPAKGLGVLVVSPDDSMALTLIADPAPPTQTPPRAGTPPVPMVPGSANDLRRLWVADSAAKTWRQLTDVAPVALAWWPDSRRVVYAKADGSLWWRKVDVSSPEEVLRPAGSVSISSNQLHVAPDGHTIVWAGRAPGETTGRFVLWGLTGIDPSAPGGGRAVQIQKLFDFPTASISTPRVSPDSQFVAFVFGRQGRGVVAVRPLLRTGPVVEVGLDAINGAAPEWHGRQIYWRRNVESGVQIVASDNQLPPHPMTDPPQVVYTHTAGAALLTTIDQLSSDGKRIIGAHPDTMPGPPQINLILNWVEELKQRVK